jgi:hypothetical protein
VVWAEARSTPSAGGGITQVSRVGIRVYLSVGPGGPPAADFTIDSLTARRSPDGRPVVLASVHNTGGRALDMNAASSSGPHLVVLGVLGLLGLLLALAGLLIVRVRKTAEGANEPTGTHLGRGHRARLRRRAARRAVRAARR